MKTEQVETMPRCPICWQNATVFKFATNDYRCPDCHVQFNSKGERLHDWQFYANGSFCRRCGASIGSPYSCR